MVGRAAEILEALRDRGVELLLDCLVLGIAGRAKAGSKSGGAAWGLMKQSRLGRWSVTRERKQ